MQIFVFKVGTVNEVLKSICRLSNMCNMLIRLVFAITLISWIFCDDQKAIQLLDFVNEMSDGMYRFSWVSAFIDNLVLKLEIKNFSYTQSDGQSREETINIINKGTPEQELIVEGKYSYTLENGEEYTVQYKADKKGFQPTIERGSKFAKQTPSVSRLSPNLAASLVG